MKKPEHTHYLIKLHNGRYLCHERSNTACVYRYTDVELMRYDLNITGGELVALTPARRIEVFVGVQYDNTNKIVDASELREELIGLSNCTNTYVNHKEAS